MGSGPPSTCLKNNASVLNADVHQSAYRAASPEGMQCRLLEVGHLGAFSSLLSHREMDKLHSITERAERRVLRLLIPEEEDKNKTARPCICTNYNCSLNTSTIHVRTMLSTIHVP